MGMSYLSPFPDKMSVTANVFVLLTILACLGWAKQIYCPYDYVAGEWKFHVEKRGKDEWQKCSVMGKYLEIDLENTYISHMDLRWYVQCGQF